MIFLGDIAPCKKVLPRVVNANAFAGKILCGNLESGIFKQSNHGRAVPFLTEIAIIKQLTNSFTVMSLANNHISDGVPVFAARQLYESAGIHCFGAGKDIFEAITPARVVDSDGTVINLVAFGWPVIGCKPAGETKAGVAPLWNALMLAVIRSLASAGDGSKTVVFVHWDYELEIAPCPAHRVLAKKCIAAGADAVIGGHPHLVQGIERFPSGIAAYSLGNWLVPQGKYSDGILTYPKDANLQLALEIDFIRKECVCHWFEYNLSEEIIEWKSSTELTADAQSGTLTTYADLGDDEYEQWFRKARVKRRGLPVFGHRDSQVSIWLKTLWVRLRQRVVVRIRSLQNRYIES